MKNVLKEKPNRELFGSNLVRSSFVEDKDLKDKNVLEIGFGYGWCVLDFLDRGVGFVVGLDVDKKLVNQAKKTIKYEKTQFLHGSAIELPFEDNYFDTVVSWEVLEHIPKKTEEKMFSEVYRVLKPGGQFYLSTQFRHPLAMLLDPAWWLISHRHYSLDNIKVFAERAGFEINKIFTRGGIFAIVYILNMYFSKWVLRRQPLWHEFFKKMLTTEYQSSSGFVNIFAKMSK